MSIKAFISSPFLNGFKFRMILRSQHKKPNDIHDWTHDGISYISTVYSQALDLAFINMQLRGCCCSGTPNFNKKIMWCFALVAAGRHLWEFISGSMWYQIGSGETSAWAKAGSVDQILQWHSPLLCSHRCHMGTYAGALLFALPIYHWHQFDALNIVCKEKQSIRLDYVSLPISL
jgi:hypothetical protein